MQRYTEDVRAKERPLPEVHDAGSYLDVRVRRSQLEGYYDPKARLMRRQRLQMLKAVEVTLALVAAALAATAATLPGVAAWVTVVTTAARCRIPNWSLSASRSSPAEPGVDGQVGEEDVTTPAD